MSTSAGEIDVYTAPLLREALDEQMAAGRTDLVVDLDEVTFLDSTGLGVLVGRLKLVRGQNGTLRIVSAQDRILKVFRITGLDKVFHIYDSIEDAAQRLNRQPLDASPRATLCEPASQPPQVAL